MKYGTLTEHEFILSLGDYITQEGLREEIRLLADSMSTHKAFAEKVGVSSQFLSNVLAGKRLPGPKLYKFLKVKPVTVFQEIK